MDEKNHNSTKKNELRARRPVRPDTLFWLLTALAVVNFVVCWIYLMLAAPPEFAENPVPDKQMEADAMLLEQDAYSANEIPLEDDTHTEKAGHLQNESKGKVLIVRGILTVFSLGMDELAKKLRRKGYDVQVTTAAKSNQAAKRMRDDIRRRGNNHPLIIIGHSLGGDLAPKTRRDLWR